MTKFKFGKLSLARIATLEPDLQRVVSRAMSWQIMDFSVIQARRTQAEQDALYAQGRTVPGPIVTWTRNSNHLPNQNGFAEACDCAPYPYDPKAERLFWMLQGILMAAAVVEDVKIRSGADFNENHIYGDDRTIDLPHIELDT